MFWRQRRPDRAGRTRIAPFLTTRPASAEARASARAVATRPAAGTTDEKAVMARLLQSASAWTNALPERALADNERASATAGESGEGYTAHTREPEGDSTWNTAATQ